MDCLTCVLSLLVELDVFRGRQVCIEMGRSPEGGLRDEEDDERQADASENGDEVERPWPPNRVGDLADQDGREECAAEDSEVGQSHALAAFLRGG